MSKLGTVYFFEFWLDDQHLAFANDIGFLALSAESAEEQAALLADSLNAFAVPTVMGDVSPPGAPDTQTMILRGPPHGPLTFKEEA